MTTNGQFPWQRGSSRASIAVGRESSGRRRGALKEQRLRDLTSTCGFGMDGFGHRLTSSARSVRFAERAFHGRRAPERQWAIGDSWGRARLEGALCRSGDAWRRRGKWARRDGLLGIGGGWGGGGCSGGVPGVGVFVGRFFCLFFFVYRSAARWRSRVPHVNAKPNDWEQRKMQLQRPTVGEGDRVSVSSFDHRNRRTA